MSKFEYYWTIEKIKRKFMNIVYKLLKWKNREIIQYEVNRHRNELVFDYPFRVVKLLGWTDQYEDDYYYVVFGKDRIQLVSCVGGFIWLKGKVDNFDYCRAEEVFKLNISKEMIQDELIKNNIILK